MTAEELNRIRASMGTGNSMHTNQDILRPSQAELLGETPKEETLENRTRTFDWLFGKFNKWRGRN